MAKFKGAPKLSYRGVRWDLVQVRKTYLMIERGKGLRTHEFIQVPKGCFAADDLRKAEAYHNQEQRGEYQP